jgi:hypothetical protein
MMDAAVHRRSGLDLVGRRDELGALEDELSRTVAGEFRVVLLIGTAISPAAGRRRGSSLSRSPARCTRR